MKTTKHYFNYLFLALALAFSFGLSSCSDDDENVGSRGDLIGTWQYTYYEVTEIEDGEKDFNYEDYANTILTITFKEDGTAIESETYKSNKPEIEYSTWSYKGNKLSFMYEDYPDDDETFTVTTLTSTKLVFEAHYKEKEDGITYESHEKWTLKKISE